MVRFHALLYTVLRHRFICAANRFNRPEKTASSYFIEGPSYSNITRLEFQQDERPQ